MFGSLRISSCRIDDDAREVYRASFCGTCHALRAFGGRSASLLTSYDATVLTLVATGLSEAPTPIEQRRCTALPLRRVPVTAPAPALERYIAATLVALTEAKLRDDLDDGHPIRGRIGLGLLGARRSRADAALRDLGADALARQIRALPTTQAAIETRQPAPGIADSARPSAELTGAVFAGLAALGPRPDCATTLRRMGEALGRFVYLWDATVDLARDLRRGQFNALAAAFGTADADLFERPTPEREHLRAALLDALDGCTTARAALPLHEQGPVLDGLFTTLRAKVWRRLGPPAASASATGTRAEAGDCDCCAAEACCGDCSCCGESASGLEGCNCCYSGPCDCCSVDCCCGSNKKKKQQQQQQQRDFHDPNDPTNIVR